MYTFTMRVRRNQTPSAISRGLFIIPGCLRHGGLQGTFPGALSQLDLTYRDASIAAPRAIDMDVDPAYPPRAPTGHGQRQPVPPFVVQLDGAGGAIVDGDRNCHWRLAGTGRGADRQRERPGGGG